MAVALNASSPSHLNESSTFSTDYPAHLTPTTDTSFWSSLRSRVDVILENRKRKCFSSNGEEESECEKRFKEDTLLLLQGFDSIASSLCQLTNNLDAAVQGASDLAQPSLRQLLNKDPEKTKEEEEARQTMRKRSPHGLSREDGSRVENENKQSPANISKNEKMNISKNEKMNKARNLAMSMAAKAACLAKELKSIKSDLCFMQERCGLLEEENKRLRDGFAKGERPDEDDLVRLQLEALLAEKSRLASENANLTRENQCLHQLVEYHQQTAQDLSESYEEVIRGVCLDFSSAIMEEEDEDNYDDDSDKEAPRTPTFEFSTPRIEDSEEQHQ